MSAENYEAPSHFIFPIYKPRRLDYADFPPEGLQQLAFNVGSRAAAVFPESEVDRT